MIMDNTLNQNDPFNNEMQETGRPQFLTVLCVLSYIWSGLVILGLLIILAMSSFIFGMFEKMVNGEMEGVNLNESQIEALNKLITLGTGAFTAIIAAVLIACILSLVGVIKMWKLQK